MSGHSKWSSIKHKKAITDSKRGRVFTKMIKEITIAARLGGGDINSNPRLRTAVTVAKKQSMPNDNIDRAIKKGTGEIAGASLEEITYEGYGPGGVAFVVKCTTDNKQRAAQEVRSIFAHSGGNLASTGAVAFQFLHAGQFLIAKEKTSEDGLMEIVLDAGADDVIATAEGFEVRCGIHAFDKVAHALEKKNIKPDSAEIAYIPVVTVPVANAEHAQALAELHDALEDFDDVQQVFSNEESE